MPGSTVTTLPASSVSSTRSRARRLVDLEPTPWPRPWPKLSPKPAAAITSRASRVGLDAGHARADRSSRGELRLEADVVGARSSSGERRRSRTCACSRSSSRRAARPSRATTSVLGLDEPVAGLGVRLRAVRAGARRPCSKRRCRRRRARARARRSRQASSRSVRPIQVSAVSASKAWSAARAARRIVLELALVLDGAQRLDEPRRAARARARREPSACDLRVRERVGLEADRGRSSRSARSAYDGALELDDLDALDRPRRLDVAEVGEEPHAAPARRAAPRSSSRSRSGSRCSPVA